MSIRAFRAMGAAFALVILGALAQAAFLLPSTNGPGLGDVNVNPFTLAQGINLDNQSAVSSGLVASATTQATCTVIANPNNQFSTVAASGAACLPPAVAGRRVWISNEGANALQLFGSNTPVTPSTQDTINTVAGSTAYAHPIANKLTLCFAEANGAWRCSGDL